MDDLTFGVAIKGTGDGSLVKEAKDCARGERIKVQKDEVKGDCK
jgi:hypothetical protein